METSKTILTAKSKLTPFWEFQQKTYDWWSRNQHHFPDSDELPTWAGHLLISMSVSSILAVIATFLVKWYL